MRLENKVALFTAQPPARAPCMVRILVHQGPSVATPNVMLQMTAARALPA